MEGSVNFNMEEHAVSYGGGTVLGLILVAEKVVKVSGVMEVLYPLMAGFLSCIGYQIGKLVFSHIKKKIQSWKRKKA